MEITLNEGCLQIKATVDTEIDLVKKLDKFVFKLTGSSLEVYSKKENELLCLSDVVDNSVFVVNSHNDAFEIAELLGSKRFILSGIKDTSVSGSQLFARDRKFSIEPNEIKSSAFEAVVGMDEIKKRFSKDQLYKELASLYNKYADFTEGKKEEYTAQEVEDKFCRFNSDQVTPIIMLNKEKNIIGTIRLFNVPCQGYTVVYLSDEVVKYNTLEDRKPMMGELFNIVRSILTQIPKLGFAYIRVASGREAMYEELGCAKSNTDIPVIHGGPTPLLDAIKKFVKEIAQYKLSLNLSSSKEPFGFSGTKKEDIQEEKSSSHSPVFN